jgi:hypothetical protein
MNLNEYAEKQNPSETQEDDLLIAINEDLRPVDDEIPEDENETDSTAEKSPVDTAAEKKRFGRLNKLGAKSITKGADIAFANIARKIAFADSALSYRADVEALEDLSEVLEEVLPKKPGQELAIPIWVQLLLYFAIAFLPVMFAALGDRSENKQLRREEVEIRRLKKQRKIAKMQLKNKELQTKLDSKEEPENENALDKKDEEIE